MEFSPSKIPNGSHPRLGSLQSLQSLQSPARTVSEAEVDCVGESGASAASKSLIMPRDMRLEKGAAQSVPNGAERCLGV